MTLPPHSRQKWRHSLLALTITVIVICAAEFGLRMAGIGFEPHFFIETPDGQYLTANPAFAWQYFPPAMAPEPVPFRVPVTKAAGTKRIVIIGDSVAAGFPDVSFSFGRVLDTMLRHADSNTTYEVINTATVAFNSHVARRLARDAERREADIIITYLGNTEILGPFGPGTAFGGHSPGLTAIRLRHWLGGTRLGQLRQRTAQALNPSSASGQGWGGMEMFMGNPIAVDDKRLTTARRHFRSNLKSIAARADSKDGPQILFCTVPTNLRDAAPFGSTLKNRTRGRDRQTWIDAFNTGTNHEARIQYALAAKAYEDAAHLDDQYAEMHFRLATCLEGSGRGQDARTHYERARDLDTLRFRTDSGFNTIIRELAAPQPDRALKCVDIERYLGEHSMSASGCPGEDYFHEHVHLNFDGHYSVARALFDTLMPGITPLSRVECARALNLDAGSEYRMALSILDIVRRPPFTHRFDHAERLQRQIDRVAFLQKRQSPETKAAAVVDCEALLKEHPHDPHLLTRLARLYTDYGRYTLAAEMWQRVAEVHPLSASVQHNLGTALMRAGDAASAETHCRRAVEQHPHIAGYWNNLGNVLFMTKQYAKAADIFSKAIKRDTTLPSGYLNLGGVYATVGKNEQAIEQFMKAVALDPENAKAHNNMGAAYEAMQKTQEARDAYSQAVLLDAQYVDAHLNLATLYQNTGELAKAVPHYARVAELRPKDHRAHYNLAVALAASNELDAAIRELVVTLQLKPGWADAQSALKKVASIQAQRTTRSE